MYVIDTAEIYDYFIRWIWSIIGTVVIIFVGMVITFLYGWNFSVTLFILLVVISSGTLFIWAVCIREPIRSGHYGLAFGSGGEAIDEVWDEGTPVSLIKDVRETFAKRSFSVEGEAKISVQGIEVTLPYTGYVRISNVFKAHEQSKGEDGDGGNRSVLEARAKKEIEGRLTIKLQKDNVFLDQESVKGKNPLLLEEEIGKVSRLVLTENGTIELSEYGVTVTALVLASAKPSEAYTAGKSKSKLAQFDADAAYIKAKSEAQTKTLIIDGIVEALIKRGISPESAAYYAYLFADTDAKSISLVQNTDPALQGQGAGMDKVAKIVEFAIAAYADKNISTTNSKPATTQKKTTK